MADENGAEIVKLLIFFYIKIVFKITSSFLEWKRGRSGVSRFQRKILEVLVAPRKVHKKRHVEHKSLLPRMWK
jgi:hypothetical protein